MFRDSLNSFVEFIYIPGTGSLHHVTVYTRWWGSEKRWIRFRRLCKVTWRYLLHTPPAWSPWWRCASERLQLQRKTHELDYIINQFYIVFLPLPHFLIVSVLSTVFFISIRSLVRLPWLFRRLAKYYYPTNVLWVLTNIFHQPKCNSIWDKIWSLVRLEEVLAVSGH